MKLSSARCFCVYLRSDTVKHQPAKTVGKDTCYSGSYITVLIYNLWSLHYPLPQWLQESLAKDIMKWVTFFLERPENVKVKSQGYMMNETGWDMTSFVICGPQFRVAGEKENLSHIY